MLKQKRAGYAQPVIDYMATITIILILIIFFILFKISAGDYQVKIKSDISTVDGNIILLNYLRTPVEYDGEQITMAELLDRVTIEEGWDTRTFVKVVRPPTFRYLESFHAATGCSSRIIFNIDGNSIEVAFNEDTTDDCKKMKRFYIAKQVVPSLKGRTTIVEFRGGVQPS